MSPSTISTITSERGHFLVRAILNSLGGGALGILSHVLYHLAAHVIADTNREVSAIKALLTIIESNIGTLIILALLGVLFGLFRFVWTIAPGNRPNPRLNGADLITLCEGMYEPNLKTRQPAQVGASAALPDHLQTIGQFLEIVGVVERVGDNARPVSGLADAFLCSLSASLREERSK